MRASGGECNVLMKEIRRSAVLLNHYNYMLHLRNIVLSKDECGPKKGHQQQTALGAFHDDLPH